MHSSSTAYERQKPTNNTLSNATSSGSQPWQQRDVPTPNNVSESNVGVGTKRPLVHPQPDVFDRSAVLRKYFSRKKTLHVPGASSTAHSSKKRKQGAESIANLASISAIKRMREARASTSETAADLGLPGASG